MLFRGCRPHLVIVSLTSAAEVAGSSDHSKAMAPVTNGVAALVPPNECGLPAAPRLVIFSPGAANPRLPTELLRFDSRVGLPRWSHAITGKTQGCRVIAELPTVP